MARPIVHFSTENNDAITLLNTTLCFGGSTPLAIVTMCISKLLLVCAVAASGALAGPARRSMRMCITNDVTTPEGIYLRNEYARCAECAFAIAA